MISMLLKERSTSYNALDSVWVSNVSFTVGAPVMSFVSKQIKDDGSAHPNGKLDPGETADLEVTITNTGLGNDSLESEPCRRSRAQGVRCCRKGGQDACVRVRDLRHPRDSVERDGRRRPETGARHLLRAACDS